jgi:hypothetical protein
MEPPFADLVDQRDHSASSSARDDWVLDATTTGGLMEKTTLLTLGVLLLLVGMIGQVRAKELEVGTRNPFVRIILGVMGAVFIAVALRADMVVFLSESASTAGAVTASPIATEVRPSPIRPSTPVPSTPATGKPSVPRDQPSDRIRERVDYPFVDDPAAVGAWRAVDFVSQPAAFVPGQKSWSGQFGITELRFLPGGKTSMAWRWT